MGRPGMPKINGVGVSKSAYRRRHNFVVSDHAVKSYAIEDELAEFGDRLNFQPDGSADDPPF